MKNNLRITTGLLLSGCLAIMTCYVSMNLDSRFVHRQETIDEQFAILEGRPYNFDGRPAYFPEFQNRVLFPLLLRAVTSLGGLSTGQWYIILRLATAFSAFLAIWLVMTGVVHANSKSAAVGLGLVAYELIFTYNHGWEHTSDFLDLFFLSLITAAAVGRRRLLVAGLVLVASFNRESSLFAGVVWFYLHGIVDVKRRRLAIRETAFAAILCLLGLCSVLIVRFLFGGPQALAPQTVAIRWFPKYISELAAHPTPFSWPVLMACMALPIFLWSYLNRDYLRGTSARLLGAAITVDIISGTFSIMVELRTFIPAITIAIIACVIAESGLQRVPVAAPAAVRSSE